MRIHYMGKFNNDPDSLPFLPHEENAVPFKEAKDPKTLAIIANTFALVLLVIFAIPYFLRFGMDGMLGICVGSLLSMVTLFPHEFLHAICLKEDAYIYSNLKQGMMFVVGPERMTKARFIFMSMLPNIVFGFIPFIVGLIFDVSILAGLGVSAISMGAGDYYNVFNALTQMPKGAKTYLHKFNSYWYMPKGE